MTTSNLLVVLPASQLQLTDPEVEELVFRALGVERAGWGRLVLQDAATTSLPLVPRSMAPMPKSLIVNRGLEHFVAFYRQLTATTDLSALTGARALAPDAPELRTLRTTAPHFTPRVVYAQHPLDRSFYIPLAQFHNYLLEDKESEFVELLAALGARTVEVIDERTERTDVDAKAKIPNVGGADLHGHGADRVGRQYRARFGAAPARPPAVPARRRWYDRERTWQTLATLRVDAHLAEHELLFEHTSDFAIDASVAARVQAFNFSLGGAYHSFTAVRRRLHITFFD